MQEESHSQVAIVVLRYIGTDPLRKKRPGGSILSRGKSVLTSMKYVADLKGKKRNTHVYRTTPKEIFWVSACGQNKRKNQLPTEI